MYTWLCAITELKEAFMLFDYGKSGTVSNQDIGSLIRSVGLKPSQAEVNEIVNEVGGSDQWFHVWCPCALVLSIQENNNVTVFRINENINWLFFIFKIICYVTACNCM